MAADAASHLGHVRWLRDLWDSPPPRRRWRSARSPSRRRPRPRPSHQGGQPLLRDLQVGDGGGGQRSLSNTTTYRAASPSREKTIPNSYGGRFCRRAQYQRDSPLGHVHRGDLGAWRLTCAPLTPSCRLRLHGGAHTFVCAGQAANETVPDRGAPPRTDPHGGRDGGPNIAPCPHGRRPRVATPLPPSGGEQATPLRESIHRSVVDVGDDVTSTSHPLPAVSRPGVAAALRRPTSHRGRGRPDATRSVQR